MLITKNKALSASDIIKAPAAFDFIRKKTVQ
jgi:hypothetical protein